MDGEEYTFDYTKRNMGTVGPDEAVDKESRLISADEAGTEMRQLLDECEVYWSLLQPSRDRRERVRKYVRGDQWSDLIVDPEDSSKTISEKDMIIRNGKTPMVNNQMRQLQKHLVGQYRQTDYKPQVYAIKKDSRNLADMMSNALLSVYSQQEIRNLDARQLEETLMSGFYCWRTSYGWDTELAMHVVNVDNCNMTRMFWNTDLFDPRGKDLRVIGMFHDMHINEAVQVFAKADGDEEKIRGWFENARDVRGDYYQLTGSDVTDNMDFLYPHDTSKCRIFEIWRQELITNSYIHDYQDGMYYLTDYTREEVEVLNQMRIMEAAEQGIPPEMVAQMDYEEKKENTWVVYFMDYKGNILHHDVTEYEHGEHPFTLGLHPMIDGEFWGVLEDILDQQKQINRLLSLMDFMIGASHKGVTFFPREMIPDGWDENDVAKATTRYNGYVFYDGAKAAKLGIKPPQQSFGNAHNAGASELLAIQLKLLQEISGVNEAIQGQAPAAGTPAARYAQETNNAAISNQDIFETFNAGKKKRDLKIVQTIRQYYDEKRMIYVSGKEYKDDSNIYDPDKVRDVRFDTTIGVGSNNPAYRMAMDDQLMQFWQQGGIPLEMLLEHSALPFAENLLESIKGKTQELEQEGANPEFLKALGMAPGGGPTDTGKVAASLAQQQGLPDQAGQMRVAG